MQALRSSEGVWTHYGTQTTESSRFASQPPGFWAQLRLMLWKNWRQKMRNKVTFGAEVLLPVLFMLTLVAIHWGVGGSSSEGRDSGFLSTAGNFSDVHFLEWYIPLTSTTKALRATEEAGYPRILFTATAESLLPVSVALCRCTYFIILHEVAAGGDAGNCDTFTHEEFARRVDAILAPRGVSKKMIIQYQSVCDAQGGATALRESAIHTNREHMEKYVTTVAGRTCYTRRDFDMQCQYLGVIVSGGPTTLQLTIRVNSSSVSGSSDNTLANPCGEEVPSTRHKKTNFAKGISDHWKGYICSGFVAMQAIGAEFAMQSAGGPEHAARDFSYKAMPAAGYTEDEFLDKALTATFTQLLILGFFTFSIGELTKLIVQERELKIREGLQMMGLWLSVYWAHWWLTYFLIYFLMAAMLTMVSCINIFSKSSGTLVFVFWFVFLLGVLQYSCLISLFFKVGNVASTVSMVVFLTLYFPGMAKDTFTAPYQYMLLSLDLPAGFSLAFTTLTQAEAGSVGINWENMMDASIDEGAASFGHLLVILSLDIVIYAVLTWYFDKVLPQDVGVPLKPWFCFVPSYWLPAGPTVRPDGDYDKLSTDSHSDDSTDPLPNEQHADIECCSMPSGNSGIVLEGLCKSFDTPDGKKIAVEDLSMQFCEGHITAFLGPNGAGKTTTVMMLSGMVAPTAGDAHICGYSIVTDLQKARFSLGLCPQQDVLFNDLDVEEHLWLYASLKGIAHAELDHEIQQVLQDVDLLHKRSALVQALSGGMKRKLSVAIALIGNPRTVLLDEPSSGLDPGARRHLWELLRSSKNSRTLVLCTHFMDEADALGDRVAIISNGKLRCYGTPLFLKSRFGVGYTLTVVIEGGEQAGEFKSQIHKLVGMHIPKDAHSIISSAGAEIVFEVSLDSNSEIAGLLQSLDSNRNNLTIQSYGLSVTSMEQVFLKVASETQDCVKHTDSIDLLIHCADATISMNRDKGRWVRHFYAILYKKYHYSTRDTRSFYLGILTPIFSVIFGCFMYSLFTNLEEPALHLTACALHKPVEVLYGGVSPMPSYTLPGGCSVATERFETLHSRSPFSSCNSNDVSHTPSSIFTSSFGAFLTKFDTKQAVLGNCNNSQIIAVDNIDNIILRNSESHSGDINSKFRWDFAATINNEASIFSGAAIWHNSASFHALPMGFNMWTNGLMHINNASLSVTSHPWPITENEKENVEFMVCILISLLLTVGFSFVPVGVVSSSVQEAQTHTRHMQRVAGVSPSTYYLGTYLWDFVVYLIPSSIMAGMVLLFDVRGLDQCPSALFVLMIMYGLSVIPYSYMTAHLFSDYVHATMVSLAVNITCGLCFVIGSFIMSLFDVTKNANEVLQYLLFLQPVYALGYSLFEIVLYSVNDQYESQLHTGEHSIWSFSCPVSGDDGSKFSDFKVNAGCIGTPLLYMGMESVVYLLAAMFFQRYALEWSKLVSKDAVVEMPQDEHEDVSAARHAALSQPLGTDAIELREIQKVYDDGSTVAVRSLSLGIPQGECFGLLGVNGAGKSTTMGIITGAVFPSSGSVHIGGLDVSNAVERQCVFDNLGCCPQIDALFPKLTVAEHISLFAQIRGVPTSELGSVINQLCNQLGLIDYQNKLASSLSGGTKRKLCVANALIGNPSVVTLDEPSTGMDPVARRMMWQILCQTMARRSIVLSTHSMEEAEALCSRIGIMVKGLLVALGCPQRLKTLFGDFYTVTLHTQSHVAKQMEEWLRGMLPEIQRTEYLNETQQMYRVPSSALMLAKHDQVHKGLPALFELISAAPSSMKIERYAISQMTLEEVFIKLVASTSDAQQACKVI